MATTAVDPTVPTTPGVAPGVGTTEYKTTKLAVFLGIAATVVGLIIEYLPAIQTAFPSKAWTGIALSIAGVLATVLTTLGYQVTRAQVKIAASAAAAAPSSVTASMAAANALGT